MKRLVLLLCLCVLVSAPAQARKIFSEEDVPPLLKPWQRWVLSDYEKNPCPFYYNNAGQRECAWTSKLSLDAGEHGGSFTYDVMLHDEAWITLPGSADYWPLSVSLNGAPGIVVPRNTTPSMFLPAGRHHITGRFAWKEMPEMMALPANLALLSLKVGDSDISSPETNGASVWLRKRMTKASGEAQQADHLEIKAFRRIEDSVPLLIETALVLQVSGKSRETVLGQVLLDNTVPVRIDSPLPARLEPDGRLRAQVKPGRWTITITARAEGPVKSLKLPEGDKAIAEEEIWLFAKHPELRLVRIEGAKSIDAQQTALPDAWKQSQLPAYYLRAGDEMTLIEETRGDTAATADQLTLSREWWLDFDGRGLSVRDALGGQIMQSWRLTAQPEMALGRVSINGQDQYITHLDKGGDGIEVRRGPIQLEADSRIPESRGTFSASGWQIDVQRLNGTLHLPPGWRLFAYSGVDIASPSWIDRWKNLYSVFLVLITVVVMHRMLGLRAAILGTVGLVLLHPELPGFTGAALFIMAMMALLRVLPEGRLRLATIWLRRATIAITVLALLPFMVEHVREAIYPQLETPYNFMPAPRQPMPQKAAMVAGAAGDMAVNEGAAMAPPPPAMEMDERKDMVRSKIGLNKMMDSLKSDYSSSDQSQSFYQYNPDNKVQTGLGIANWQGNNVSLSWSGPVEPSQQTRLWLMSPLVNLILAAARVIFASLLLIMLLGIPLTPYLTKLNLPGLRKAAVLIAVIGGIAWTMLPTQAIAQETAYPSKEMLDELRKRLIAESERPPECIPDCANVASTILSATPSSAVITQEIHAQDNVAVPLPGGGAWRPTAVTVDGEPATMLRYDSSGYLLLGLSKGVHQVKLSGPLADNGGTVSIGLPLPSAHAEATAEGWEVQGISENGRTEGTLQLTRSGIKPAAKEEAEPTLESTHVPPYFLVTRRLVLGIEWSLETTVTRVTPADEGLAVSIPLLEGETLTTAGIQVKDGKAYISLPAQEMSRSWTSSLTPRAEILLKAPDKDPWSEIWQVGATTLWHVERKGIPSIHGSEGQVLEWHPWPGESVTLDITRPAGSDGKTKTIDSASLDVKAGQRALDAKLDVTLRSSQGGQHAFTLPQDAKLKSVMINGQSVPPQQKETQVIVPVTPGSQKIALQWTQSRGIAQRFVTPTVNLGEHAVNLDISLNVPRDRWILLLSGPDIGPAILFWAWIPLVLLFAFGLSRVKDTPLRGHDWLLLLMGLSQQSLGLNLIIVGWLLAIGWRARQHSVRNNDSLFNLRQVVLGLLTAISLLGLLASIRQGLLGTPEMDIIGNGSSAYLLRWYQDMTDGQMPRAVVWSVPVWVYRILMLLWALWLASALVRWLKWGWQSFSEGGYWKK